MLKKFPRGLKQNLREEDKCSTRDNWPAPNPKCLLFGGFTVGQFKVVGVEEGRYHVLFLGMEIPTHYMYHPAGMRICQYVDLCFHASPLPCLHTFWHVIPTSFYIFIIFLFLYIFGVNLSYS